MSCNPRGSLITHPDAISFLCFLQEGVFQQPRDLSFRSREADRVFAMAAVNLLRRPLSTSGHSGQAVGEREVVRGVDNATASGEVLGFQQRERIRWRIPNESR